MAWTLLSLFAAIGGHGEIWRLIWLDDLNIPISASHCCSKRSEARMDELDGHVREGQILHLQSD